MKIAIAYIYPVIQIRKFYPLAQRFAQTYQRFPAGLDHQLTVLCNGREASRNEISMFDGSPVEFFPNNNAGWDIGGFQKFAEVSEADLLVCLGSFAHFHRSGWLKAMADAWLEYGPGLFGCAAYLAPDWHVRTTSFWCPPDLIRSYPAYIGSSRTSRYEFEFGKTSFTRHVLKLGFPCVMVTWRGCFPFRQWGTNPYIMNSEGAPTASEILVRDQHIHT